MKQYMSEPPGLLVAARGRSHRGAEYLLDFLVLYGQTK